MKKEDKFLVIKKGKQDFAYGGNQAWFDKATAKIGACGVVAAANAFLGLAYKDKDISKKLSLKEEENGSILYENYKAFMELLYGKMKTIEIPFYSSLYNRIGKKYKWQEFIEPSYGMTYIRYICRSLSFAEERKIYLKCKKVATAYISEKKALRFLKAGIKRAGIVTVLVSKNEQEVALMDKAGVKKVKDHFYSITEIQKDGEGNLFLIGSSWGEKFKISFMDWQKSYQSIMARGSGMVYFIKAKNREESQKERVKVFIFILRTLLALSKGVIKKSYNVLDKAGNTR